MAAQIQFVPPYDIHLLRGQSFQVLRGSNAAFVDLLEIDGISASDYLATHSGSRLQFSFSFITANAASFNISLPASNSAGLITLLPTEPTTAKFRIRNFNLFAELTEAVGTVTTTSTTAIRIHIHKQITEVWISPNPLTVSRSQIAQPALRARFDDDVVAELWNIPRTVPGNRASYNITNPIVVQWSSTPTNPSLIEPNEGWLESNPSSPLSTYKITASVSYTSQTLRADGDIILSDVLSQNTSERAELVTTGGSPGFSMLNTIPNIIFIPDGFRKDDPTLQIEDETNFNKLVDDYVNKLTTNGITEPFKTLRASINYWKLFLPSRESGVTFRGEFFVENVQPNLIGQPIPFIINPGTQSITTWKPEHLLFRVGLPVRAEMRSTTNNQPVITDLIDKWEVTTKLTASDITYLKTNTALLLDWQKYADRRLPEARDTVLGVTVNNYTAAVAGATYNAINIELTRLFRLGLDKLFNHLLDLNGKPIGAVFTSELFPRVGKDMANVVILSATDTGRDQNTGYAIYCRTATRQNTVSLTPLVNLKASVIPPTIGPILPMEPTGTITHEICHSFGLGDEYGEDMPPFYTIPVTDPAVVTRPNVNFVQSNAKKLDLKSNLQAQIDLQTTKPIDPLRLKWRYHRIQACTTVTAIKRVNATLELTLLRTQSNRFAVGDPVFIRKRKKNPKQYFIQDQISKARLATILDPDPFPVYADMTTRIDAIPNADSINVTFSPTGFNPFTGVIQVEKGQASGLSVGQQIEFNADDFSGPIYTTFHTPAQTPGGPNQIEIALSPQLTVKTVSTFQITVTIPASTTLSPYLLSLTNKEEMVVYKPVSLPAGVQTTTYPFAELISKKVLDHLIATPIPFNTDTQNREFIQRPTTYTRIPASLVGTSLLQNQIIGLYAGGEAHHGGVYHPAAECLMRFQVMQNKYIPLCAVCRYTLINLVNPSQLATFDTAYMALNIYPS